MEIVIDPNEFEYLWVAIFKDGTVIPQLNIDGSENKFQLVKDNFKSLAKFELADFVVDMEKQTIRYKGTFIGSITDINPELIYYRHNIVTFDKHEIIYCVGIGNDVEYILVKVYPDKITVTINMEEKPLKNYI